MRTIHWEQLANYLHFDNKETYSDSHSDLIRLFSRSFATSMWFDGWIFVVEFGSVVAASVLSSDRFLLHVLQRSYQGLDSVADVTCAAPSCCQQRNTCRLSS